MSLPHSASSLAASVLIVLAAAACERPGTPATTSNGKASTAAAPAPAPAVSPPLPPVEPVISNAPAARITQSSVLEAFDASGVLSAAEPGWHAARNPTYPQSITIEFKEKQSFNRLSLLPQDTVKVRGPKQVDVEVSANGKDWNIVQAVTDACASEENRWKSLALDKPIDTRWLRLTVHSNCGDPDFLTLRGIKLE
jgi:hypothetical protein